MHFKNHFLKHKNDYIAYLLLLASSIFHGYLWLTSEGIGFGGDSFNHFRFARYSWEHPELLLHLWAKPFFTLISSPFAQLGFGGIEFFNILSFLGSAYFLYRICKALGYAGAWAVIIFLAFIPVYMFHLASGYTEPFFGFVITLSLFLLIRGKVAWAIILASFLPFVRSEGFFFLPIFFLVLVFKKHYKYIPLLLFGLVLYSLIGYPFKGDIFWVFTENPYRFDSSVYGSGPFTHFIDATPKIFGQPLIILSFIGLIFWVFEIIRYFPSYLKTDRFNTALVFIGGLWAYFLAHTIFWWQGIFGSLGLTRVMAGIAPCLAFSAIIGIQALWALSLKWVTFKWIPKALTVGFAIWVVILPFEIKDLPIEMGREAKHVKKATLWLKDSEYFPPERLYYMNQIVPFFLEMDPFDHKKVRKLNALNNENPGKNIPKGSVIYWDSHYGPNEGKLKKETLLNSPRLKMIKHIKPEPTFKVLGDNVFEIYFFVKK